MLLFDGDMCTCLWLRFVRLQFETKPLKCLEMCSALGIRFKPKSAVQGREVKYSSFKNTKSKIGMIKAAEIQTRALREKDAARVKEVAEERVYFKPSKKLQPKEPAPQ